MTDASPVLAEVWRGPVRESVHRGAAVVVDGSGAVVDAWGDPSRVILPRSACKMLQALPLVESGAADTARLSGSRLALACASHNAAAVHVEAVSGWLAELGLGEGDLRCGPQPPTDAAEAERLRAAGARPGQVHNNCSGKHCGFLTLNRHLGGSPEYVDPAHPVQQAVRAATEEMCGEDVRGFAIDGCSAPNFAVTLSGLAAAMARFAAAERVLTGARAAAAVRLRDAMMAYPVMVAGEGRACTDIMRAAEGRAAVKTGAEAVFTAILPERGLGIALKIDDGGTRGSEAAIAALLARHGALDRGNPVYQRLADAPLLNRRGIDCGRIRVAETLLS